ncbi:MAG: anti-sigma factor antagonist [Candidatus Eiseniibacteriota bacterium]|nr:MAG: anti-sigma factor antagonist [Candidatus Eisenbacteria bacterium]
MKGIDVIVEQAGSRYQIVVVRVLGQIDTTTSHELERRLQFLLKDHQFHIVIDLSKVTYISSAGWGIFISEIRGIRESGGDLKLTGMTPEVAEVFELLEFHNILESFRTIQEAVERFEQPRPAAGQTPPGTGSRTYGAASDVEARAAGDASPEQASHDADAAVETSPEQTSQSPNQTETVEGGGLGKARPLAQTGVATQEIEPTGESAEAATQEMEPSREAAEEFSNETELEIVDPLNPDVKQQIKAEVVEEASPAEQVRPLAGANTTPEPAGQQLIGTGAVNREIEPMILETVKEHPEFGCLKIRAELVRRGYRKPINPLSLFLELKRLNLETKEKRRQYADSF